MDDGFLSVAAHLQMIAISDWKAEMVVMRGLYRDYLHKVT